MADLNADIGSPARLTPHQCDRAKLDIPLQRLLSLQMKIMLVEPTGFKQPARVQT
jgi:hypothetical protein